MAKLIPAEVALSIPAETREATKWPPRGDNSRLDPLALPILFPKFSISPSDRVFTIGSCFARNIEEYLSVLGFDVPTCRFAVPAAETTRRPSGILNKYTPASMLQEIDRTIRLEASSDQQCQKIFSECLLDVGDGAILDLELSTNTFVPMTRAIERRQQIHQLFRQLYKSDLIIITFGLIESWWDASSKLYIQRAPTPRLIKKYPDRFFYKRMDFEETLDAARGIISKLNGMGVKKKILVTTSPVPMGRTFAQQDILVANMYSKSLLRTVCEIIKEENENVDYYPSFEMVVMSKSADVWEDDLVHVTDRFVGRVVNRMIESYYPGYKSISPDQQAWSAIFARDFAAALEILEQAHTESATLDLLRGLTLLGIGDKVEGRRLVRDKCLHANLDNRQAAHVAVALQSLADPELCAKFIGTVLAHVPAEDQYTAILRARMAFILAGRGDRAGALREGKLAVQARESLVALSLVGEAFCQLGEDALAREYFQKALNKASKGPAHATFRGNAYAGLAIIERRAGNLSAALSALQRAKADAPKAKLTLAAELAMQR